MKLLSIIVFITVCECCKSDLVDLFDSMTAKINQLTNKVMFAMKSMNHKFKKVMFSTEKSKTLLNNPDLHIKNLIQKRFVDLKQKETSKRESAMKDISSNYEYNNLRSEPTAFMSAPQLASYHGQRMESHIVITKDGYLITVHHLKSSINKYGSYHNLIPNCTVLIHHGLLGSSEDWMLLGSGKSLPYLLTNLNCDVWLINARGNHYSRGHIKNQTDAKEFWNFSWTEMGQYDLPAVIDYIRKVNNSTEPMNFIGHSLGTTAFLAMLSLSPKYNKYFRIGVLLAPLVFLGNVKSPLRLLVYIANNPPEYVLTLMGEREFLPNGKIPETIARKYCTGHEILCINSLLFISGSVHAGDSDIELVLRVLNHVPAGGSTNTILHYAQMIKSGKFQTFQNDSRELSLKDVSVPIVLFSSDGDLLAPSSDVLRLFRNISCPVDHYIIRDLDFKHTDFVWHPEADSLIFDKVIDFLRKPPSY